MTQLRDRDLEFHPLADLFPLIPEDSDEFRELVEDIRANGLREDIYLLNGKILDGRNRYRAIRAGKIDLGAESGLCEVRGLRGRSVIGADKDPLAFVISKNLRRRHLTVEQRAEVHRKLHDQGMSVRAIAEKTNTPKSTVARDIAVPSLGIASMEATIRAARERAEVSHSGTPAQVDQPDGFAQAKAALALNAMSQILSKRRARPQLERARAELANGALLRGPDTETLFASIEDAMDNIEQAMDEIDDAYDAEAKTMAREEADNQWEELGSLAEELADAVAPDEDEDQGEPTTLSSRVPDRVYGKQRSDGYEQQTAKTVAVTTEPAKPIGGGTVAVTTAPRVTGKDGKSYAASKPRAAKLTGPKNRGPEYLRETMRALVRAYNTQQVVDALHAALEEIAVGEIKL